VPGPNAAAGTAPPKLALGSYGLRWTLRGGEAEANCQSLISATADLGLDLVQIADNVDLLKLDARQLRRLAKLADDAGVHVEVGMSSYRAADFRRMVRVARAFGSRHIRVISDDLVGLGQLLAQVKDDVTKWGGEVVVENYSPTRTTELLATIAAAGGWVGTCVDTANSIPAGEWPLDTLARLLPLAYYVHIKDFHFVPGPNAIGWALIGTPLGAGQQDVGAIVRQTAAAPRHPDLVLEHWLPWQGSAQATARAERAWLEEGLFVLLPLVANAGAPGLRPNNVNNSR
jgi:sugar phosphate isomerase/epimerase